MSSKKTLSPKYTITSTPYDKITSPFQKSRKSPAYPKQFIYYNRNSKMRTYVMTKPTTEVDIQSTVDAEEALDINQKVVDAAARQIQQAFRNSSFFRKIQKGEGSEKKDNSSNGTEK